MAYCSHCGSALGAEDAVCSSCGTSRATAGWALATEICAECAEPTARGWRFCITCGTPTAVVGRGRSIRVDASQVQSWFDDLLPVDERAVDDGVEPAEPDGIPPPPPVAPLVPAATDRRGRYVNPAFAASTAQRALLSTALLATIAAGTLLLLNNRLAGFKSGTPDSFDAAVSLARLADWGTRPIALIGIVISSWYVMRWTRIVYGNILGFGKTSLRLPLSVVPWAFFVPGLNFVAPPRLINDAWRAADAAGPRGSDWMLRPGNRWTRITWFAAIAALALHLVGWTTGSSTVDAAISANRWAAAGWGAVVISMSGAVLMVQRVTERQEHRHGELVSTSTAVG